MKYYSISICRQQCLRGSISSWPAKPNCQWPFTIRWPKRFPCHWAVHHAIKWWLATDTPVTQIAKLAQKYTSSKTHRKTKKKNVDILPLLKLLKDCKPWDAWFILLVETCQLIVAVTCNLSFVKQKGRAWAKISVSRTWFNSKQRGM